MKHIFLVNPAAGNSGRTQPTLDKIHSVCYDANTDYEVHVTTAEKDAENFVRKTCESAGGAPLRFYSCGGDGTFNEVVNGAHGFPNVAVGMIPIGTGNDFTRNFSAEANFHDIGKQMRGETEKIDLIKYGNRYGANMFNIGFDCAVVVETEKIKRSPSIPDGLAYAASVIKVLGEMPTVNMGVTVDGGEEMRGEYTLIAVGNGGFCGGGFLAAPYAALNDGKIDICLVNKVTRRQFMALVGHYKKGTHLERPDAKEIIMYTKCERLDLDFSGVQTNICIDGEIETATKITFTVERGAISFICPEGSVPLYSEGEDIKIHTGA